MDINVILSQLGSFGLFQSYVYVISCIPVIIAGIVMLSPVFIGGTPKHRCFVPHCDSQTSRYNESFVRFAIPKQYDVFESCNRFASNDLPNSTSQCDRSCFDQNVTELCDAFVYDDSEFKSSVVTEWDLVCDNSWQMPFSQSIFYCGVLTGALCFGAFADRYGRRKVFYIAPFLCLASCLISSFAPNFIIFTIFSALTVGCSAGMYQTAFILGIEFVVSSECRVWCASIQQMLFSVGELFLYLLASYFRNWRDLQNSMAVIISSSLFLAWLLPESVRWQISNGQTYNAFKTISRAAKWNKVTLSNEHLFFVDQSLAATNALQSRDKPYGPLDLLRHSTTRRWAFNLFYIWIVNSLVFYGLSLEASKLGSNTYTTFALLCAVELPAIFIATVVMQRYGRKKVLLSLLVIGGLACVTPALLPSKYNWLITALAVFGKSNISASFSLIYIYSVEIFPTVLRSSGLGMCSMSSRIGGILAPYIIGLSMFGESVPLLFLGILSIIAGILMLDLPETHNKRLPETLDDVETLRYGNVRETYVSLLSEGLRDEECNSVKFGDNKEYERVQLLSDTEN